MKWQDAMLQLVHALRSDMTVEEIDRELASLEDSLNESIVTGEKLEVARLHLLEALEELERS